MLHREVLDVLGRIDGSPFAADAKTKAVQAAHDAGLIYPGGSAVDAEALLLLWRCVSAARGENTNGEAANVAEFVATLPIGLPKGARPTHLVVTGMIEAAKHEIVIVGYDFTVASRIIETLSAAAMRGKKLLIVCDRKQGGLNAIRDGWPSFAPRPTTFVNPEIDDPIAKMHSKLLIVDGENTLITSANFTYHGMYGNVEFGVRWHGVESGSAARAFVEHLIETGAVVRAP